MAVSQGSTTQGVTANNLLNAAAAANQNAVAQGMLYRRYFYWTLH